MHGLLGRIPSGIALLLALAPAAAQALVHRDGSLLQVREAAFDPVRGRLVVCALLGETLECDGVSWFRRAAERSDWMTARLVWAGDRLFAFATSRALGPENWSYDGFHWRLETSAVLPPARTDAVLVYDSARGRVVLFGGTAAVGPNYYLTDTWEWTGAAWLQRTPATSPPWRRGGAAAFDVARGVTVLFGGDGRAAFLQDTWEWNGVAWTQRTPAVRPSARTGAAMAYDAGRGQVVLHGGLSAAALESDLWSFDGIVWQPIAASNAGPTGYLHGLHHDPGRNELLVLGDSPPELHAFGGGAWRAGPAIDYVASTGSAGSATVDPGTGGVVRFGSLFDDGAHVWDRTGWQTLRPVPRPANRIFGSMWNDGTSAYLFGGINTLFVYVYSDTWRWDGAVWTPLAGTPGPPARSSAAVAYDGARGVAVLFGGSGAGVYDDTWTFDGAAWQQRNPASRPPARWSHGLAFDPVRARTVLFGGTGGAPYQPRADTWEWDGTNWQQVVTPQSPPAVGTVALGFDRRRQRVLLSQSGTQTIGTLPPSLWTYDGATWTALALQRNLAIQPGHSVLTLPGELDPLLVDGLAVLQLSVQPAGASRVGTGCGGAPPRLWVRVPARPGAAQFGLEVEGAPPLQPLALLLSLVPGSAVVGGCAVGVDPGGLPLLLLADARGAAALPLPLPAAPALLGLEAFAQAFALAPGTASGIVASATLHVVLGE